MKTFVTFMAFVSALLAVACIGFAVAAAFSADYGSMGYLFILAVIDFGWCWFFVGSRELC